MEALLKSQFNGDFILKLWPFIIPPGLLLAGRFLDSPSFWGVNHFAFSSDGTLLAWGLLALVLAALSTRKARSLVPGAFSLSHVFSSKIYSGVLLALAILAFYLFRSQTHFLGDGLLISDLINKSIPFRAYDSMDYVLHFRLFQGIKNLGEFSPASLYQLTSVLCGGLSFALLVGMLNKLEWKQENKILFLGLFFFSGPGLLFFGYVESYSFLFLFMSLFMVSGLLVFERKFPLWGAASFFGLALFFHLTAIFSFPALLYLAWRSPAKNHLQRWLHTLGPVAVMFLGALAIHLVFGFNQAWFQKEFFANETNAQIFKPVFGQNSIFSGDNLIQQLNLLALLFPVAFILFVSRIQPLRKRWKDSPTAFLLIQTLTIVLLSLALDRKLGMARDWDLLVGHSTGFLLVCVYPFSSPQDPKTGKSSFSARTALALSAALLCFVPWVAVNSSVEASLARFSRVAEGFQPYPKAYAFESLGQYHRDAGDWDSAHLSYLKCVEARPGNARFHKLLGSSYLALAKESQAQGQQGSEILASAADSFVRALELNPELDTVRDNLSRILMRQGKFSEAVPHLERVLQKNPNNDVALSSLGFAQLQLGQATVAIPALAKAMEINPQLKVRRYLGQAYFQTGAFTQAYSAFKLALQKGENSTETQVHFAESILGILESQPNPTHRQQLIEELQSMTQHLIQKNPESSRIQSLYQEAEGLQ